MPKQDQNPNNNNHKASQEEITSAIIEKLKKISIFKQISDNEEAMRLVADSLSIKEAHAGENVIVEGEEGDELFIINNGTVEIMKKTLENDFYTVVKLDESSNAFFGELALLDNDKRSATVKADTNCEFLVMSRSNFIKLGDKNPSIGLIITREIAKILSNRLRKSGDDVITLFKALVNEIGSQNEL